MQPTMRLRYVERTQKLINPVNNIVERAWTQRFLQQYLESEPCDHEYTTISGNHGRDESVVTKYKESEWRDVEVVEEA